MDASHTQSTTSEAQRPAHRDMMFCHECADEWYRDEHGLTCPECGSDFTEIIEDNNDPRDSVMFSHNDDDGDNESLSGLINAPPTENTHHNPWQSDDPDDSDISNFHFTQTAPGRFNVQATITRSVSPQGLQGGMAPGSIGGFMSMLNGLAGAAVRTQMLNQTATQDSRSPDAQGQPQIRTGRFTYHGGARLYPRDSNNPEPRVEPVDDITNVMAGLMAALGAPPGSVHTQSSQQGGAEASFRGEHDHDNGPMAAHPFLQLFSSMGLLGNGGQMGDFVYSQEGLDRIVSQLMEQTATSNAPGPATQADIDALPREHVTIEMLGPEGRAECSICMDEVNIGEEVTMLPCKHWFHHPCVSAWLLEHDTCPHCRKGISSHGEGEQNSSGANSSGQIPGATTSASSTAAQPSSGNGNDGNQPQRGWFGPFS